MKYLVKSRRSHGVKISYTADEFKLLQALFLKSNNRFLSVYIRKLSLREPVETKTRNSSFDDFVAEIIPLRKEMAALRRVTPLSPTAEAQLLELHRSIQRTIDKIAAACMPS